MYDGDENKTRCKKEPTMTSTLRLPARDGCARCGGRMTGIGYEGRPVYRHRCGVCHAIQYDDGYITRETPEGRESVSAVVSMLTVRA